MPISLVYGLPGRNKTLFSVFYALSLANKFKKSIVCNFLLHPDNLLRYCNAMQYDWLCTQLKSDKPTIYYCPMESKSGLIDLLSIPNSVIICDEAGGYLPARGSLQNTPPQFLKDITQVRHRKQYALFVTQSENLLDCAVKVLADEVIFCNGISVYDQKLDAPRLIYKTVRRFTPEKYQSWSSNARLKGNPLKSMMMANKSWTGQLTCADVFLFKVYSSFYLVHEQNEMLKADTYFPDSKARYYHQQTDSAGASAAAPRPGIVVDSDSLKILLNSSKEERTQTYKSLKTLPYVSPISLLLSPKSNFEVRLFKNLPAELLPIFQKLFSKNFIYFPPSPHKKLFICLFMLTLFFVVSDVISFISLFFHILLPSSSHSLNH